MSATSGIGISPQLASAFANANISGSVRFIKVSIQNELLIHDLTIPTSSGSFEDDLRLLQTQDILQDSTPAFILAKLAQSDWMAISYVPDSAKIRDKMLYASTRTSLLKTIGSTHFTDTIFATSKSDLTPEAYASHKRHISAPQPLSAREQEMIDIRTAESGGLYEGSRARVNYIGAGVGLRWSKESEEAVKCLAHGERCIILVMEIDRITETLNVKSVSEASIETLSSALPRLDPCYAFFAWPHTFSSPPRREVVFIYSCPTSSHIKDRMVYSTGVSTTYFAGKAFLEGASADIYVAPRKIETSDPQELTEAFLKVGLGLVITPDTDLLVRNENKSFTRPKGPARKR